jgi:hypothetical protein
MARPIPGSVARTRVAVRHRLSTLLTGGLVCGPSALRTVGRRPHQANLAVALTNLGAWFDQLDRHEEAVGIYRKLAARDPELYQAEYKLPGSPPARAVGGNGRRGVSRIRSG